MRTKVAGLIALATCILALSACDKGKGLVVLPEQPPEITLQPSSVTVATGAAAAFNVVANGEDLSYQWRKDGAPIPGATMATYTITVTTSASAGTYQVIVSNATRSTASRIVELTLSGVAVPPTILSQPESTNVLPGGTALFTVVASGTQPLVYQWFKNEIAIPDATSATYTLPGATTPDSGNYTVTVTNAYGIVTSNIAVLTVSATVPLSGGMNFRESGFAKSSAISLTVDCQDSGTNLILAERASAAWSILFESAHRLITAETEGQASNMQIGSPECETAADIMAAGTFPILGKAIRVSSLDPDQQVLVTAAIAQFVGDYDDASNTPSLAEHTSSSAFAETYVVWGSSADPALSNVEPDVTYLLIAGPGLWIEIFRSPGAHLPGDSQQVVVTAH